jgi:hypothetical protein
MHVDSYLFRRFFDTLLVDEHDSSHDQGLRFCARLGQASFDQQLVYAFALHVTDIRP